MNGGADADRLFGGIGADMLNGGAGLDAIVGGAGGDRFVFDNAAYADATAAVPLVDYINDYDRGNSSAYSAAEGDQIDLSALLAAAYGAGQAVGALVRVVQNGDSTGALVQVDTDGTVNGIHWVTIAQLDGIHIGNAVNAVLDSSQGADVNLNVLTNAGAMGDFNGDGTFDALWRNDDGTVAIWQMSNGALGSVAFPTGVPNDWHIVGIGDFNGDHTSDVLWRNDNGTVLEWLMNNGTIQSAPVVEMLTAPQVIAGVGDFNHDGRSDILLRTFNGDGSTTISVQQTNTNDTGVTTGAGFTLGSDWAIVGVGDFNGGGNSDILFRQQGTGTTTIWQMNGTTREAVVFEPGVPTDWHVVGVGNFDNDANHTSDILWGNDNGTFAVWLINTSAQPQTAGFFGVGASWHVVGTGDVNHDGRDDLIWRNDNGTSAISLMNGVVPGSTTFPGGVPAAWAPTTHHYDFV